METHSVRKVIDPHRNMPEEIKVAFFEGTREWDKGNDSYIDWTVDEHEYDEEDDPFLAKLDSWLRANFDKGEKLIILHWW